MKKPPIPDIELPDSTNDDDNDQYKPYPVEVFPPSARALIANVAQSIGCDPAYAALPALVAMSTAIGNTAKAVVSTGFEVSPMIWGCVVGRSGSGKSPAAKPMMKPIYEKHRDCIDINQLARQQHDIELAKYEQTSKKSTTTTDTKPTPPPTLLALSTDTTIEALAPALKDNPRGIVIDCDELAGFVASFDCYRSGKGGDANKYLSIFDGKDIDINRRGSGITSVRLPFVNVIGGVQPGRLDAVFSKGNIDSGFAARLLVVCPPHVSAKFSTAGMSERLNREYGNDVARLYNRKMIVDESGRPQPEPIGMTPDARQRYYQWANARRLAADSEAEDTAAAMSKIMVSCIKFSLIFAICDGKSVIELEHIDRGIELADWHIRESRRLYNRMQADELTRNGHAILDYLRRRGGAATLREITDSGLRQIGRSLDYDVRKKNAVRACNELKTLGKVRIVDIQNPRGGQPSKRIYLVEPASCNTPDFDPATPSIAGAYIDENPGGEA